MYVARGQGGTKCSSYKLSNFSVSDGRPFILLWIVQGDHLKGGGDHIMLCMSGTVATSTFI